MQSVIRVGDKTKRQKKTDIGHSPLTLYEQAQEAACHLYRRQGQPLELP